MLSDIDRELLLETSVLTSKGWFINVQAQNNWPAWPHKITRLSIELDYAELCSARVNNFRKEERMPKVDKAFNKDGDFLVDYEEKVFEDVKAKAGEKALVTFHTVAFEGSISIVNTLTATRLLRKGFETSILLYGPGVTMGFQRGFPHLGEEAFPGHLFVNQRLQQFMKEGGKIYGCRFSTQALYGQTEKAFIEGIVPINGLDVLDIILVHRRDNAVIINSWTL